MTSRTVRPRKVAVCGVQMDPRLGEPGVNADHVVAEIVAASDEGAELIVFPEAALTGYVFQTREEGLAWSVEAGGPELSAIAQALVSRRAYAVVGAIERDGDALFNSAFLMGPEGLVGRYRKVHTLCLGADRFTRPGGEPFRAFDLPFGRVGLHICYDGTFPESARALRLEGAHLLILPTNWPRLQMKRELVRVRAYENRCFYLAVNRVGEERGVRFHGGSAAADLEGELLMSAGDQPGRYAFEADLSLADRSLEVVRPGEYELDLLQDRWPGLYGAITEKRDVSRTGSRSST